MKKSAPAKSLSPGALFDFREENIMSERSAVITGGTIVDGTGRCAFKGDVVIEDDRIAAVIPSEEAPKGGYSADVVYDASGCLVTPGFIDAHAHSDAYLILEPDAPSKISQGITTEINGQCGGSAAPRYGEARLSSDWASLLGEKLVWRSFAEYRSALEKARPAINSVQFVGHNTLRSSVVGYAPRESTAEELGRMRLLLDEALDAGWYGLTTGLIYQPGKHASRDEVILLAKAAAEKDAFYATHMRSEGDGLLEAIDEVVDLVKETGVKAEISHLKTSGERNWHKIDAALDKVQSAVDEGLLLGADRYPYCAAGTDLDIVLPDWAQAGGVTAEIERLANPIVRSRIVSELENSTRDWSKVMIGGTWSNETKAMSGLTVNDVVQGSASKSVGEEICRILEADKCRTGAFFFGMSEENLDKILSKEWVVPGSDASLRAPWGPLGADHPHPRAYGTMPEFYRRLRRIGVSREEAVARMTSVPARRFSIRERGIIAKGMFADLIVWREDEFSAESTYNNPHSFSKGVKAVFVNGLLHGKGRENAGRFIER